MKGRILALDPGRRRIGLAVSDPLGITAQGLPTLERVNKRTDLAALRRLAEEYDAQVLLVGHPLHLSGQAGTQAAEAAAFAGEVERATGRPVRLWDERLTTAEAQRVLRASGLSQQKRGRAVDRLAAVLLLQNYLDHEAMAQTECAAASEAECGS